MTATRLARLVEATRPKAGSPHPGTEVGEVRVDVSADESAAFRVEIFTDGRGRYRARVLRTELFRLQSTFPQVRGRPQHRPSDEALLVGLVGVPLALEAWRPARSGRAALTAVARELVALLRERGLSAAADVGAVGAGARDVRGRDRGVSAPSQPRRAAPRATRALPAVGARRPTRADP